MDDGGAALHQLPQRKRVIQVAPDKGDALAGQVLGISGVPGQGPYGKALAQQLGTECRADESGSAGNGDQAAAGDQADATLRRNSSVTAFRLSASWEVMKSRRALARDSLPEEVLGSECGGTSST